MEDWKTLAALLGFDYKNQKAVGDVIPQVISSKPKP
jgi:hypothetical protein